jgi:hypothetical protein
MKKWDDLVPSANLTQPAPKSTYLAAFGSCFRQRFLLL